MDATNSSKISLQARLIWIVVAALFSAAAFMMVSTAYALHLVETQTSSAYTEIANTYLERVETAFSTVERQFYEIIAYETQLLQISGDSHSTQTKRAQTKMMSFLSTEANLYSFMDGFFLYFPQTGCYMEGSAHSKLLEEKLAFRADLQHYLCTVEDMDLIHWRPVQLGEQYYLLRLVRFGGSYFGTWVDPERLLTGLDVTGSEHIEHILFATTQGEVITTDPFLCSADFDFIQEEPWYFSNGYLIAEALSSYGNFKLLTLIPSSSLYADLYVMCAIGGALIAAFLVLIPFITLTIYHWVVRPVNALVRAMDRLMEGDLDSRPQKERLCKEFQILNQSFAAMSTQIKELKVSVYEEQLLKQRTELNFYQLQIHPHFFANSLNMIYHFAQAQNYRLVQELAVNLCEYYRYSIRNSGSFVSLKSELDHLQRYLDIQKLRFGSQLSVKFQVPESYLLLQIPPLIVQTFVENAIKYAISMEHLTVIRVRVSPAQEQGSICVQVEDNGPGFSEELMEEILSGRDAESRKGQRLGIYNVQQRLWLLYGEEAQLSISNLDPHGTVAEVVIPEKYEEVRHDKSNDCR